MSYSHTLTALHSLKQPFPKSAIYTHKLRHTFVSPRINASARTRNRRFQPEFALFDETNFGKFLSNIAPPLERDAVTATKSPADPS